MNIIAPKNSGILLKGTLHTAPPRYSIATRNSEPTPMLLKNINIIKLLNELLTGSTKYEIITRTKPTANSVYPAFPKLAGSSFLEYSIFVSELIINQTP
ncbi:hypothetical protein ASZ90_004191 [hydrocarbon metagenome]|uniref:Uncharacterized protein n=1 Tax=hydrocarbon metagenome TaxID=938273 RepID=A0A0W8FYG6_9ZZZZ